VPLPFHLDPTRYVSAPDGSEWTVAVRRGSAWPGWRWLDWLDDRLGEGAFGSTVPFLALLAVPSVAVRRLLYVLQRRADWRVTVHRGPQPDYRPRQAVLDEVAADRPSANMRAEQLSLALTSGTLEEGG
jgi:hypothetical protein